MAVMPSLGPCAHEGVIGIINAQRPLDLSVKADLEALTLVKGQQYE